MAYDPTKPANNSPVSSAELRAQLTGLKTLIDTKTDAAAVTNQIETGSAAACEQVDILTLSASNPPTQAQVQQVIDKLNDLILALRRT